MKFPKLKIATRPRPSFGLLMLLLVVAGGVGYWGVTSISGTTVHLLREDAHVSEHSARARADVLLLRRFEKDIFLNVTDATKVEEYHARWNEAKDDLEQRIADLEKYTVSREDKVKVRTIRDSLILYADGFDRIHAMIRDGKIRTPAAGNAAVARYKEEAYRMENVAREFAEEGIARMDADELLVVSRTQTTAIALIIVSFLATLDIIGKKKSARALARNVRAYKTLGRCNEAMVRAPDEARLIEEICRILVEEGGYGLAWVGFTGRDGNETVRPAGWAGKEAVEFENADLTLGEDGSGRGLAGTAIRTEQTVVVPDIANDPIYSRWIPEAIRRRFASGIALPLACGCGHAIGALSLYSEKKMKFDVQEIALMSRLADDLAFGVCAARAFEGQNLLNKELTTSREALRDLARDIQSAREEERATVAREIHDVLGQELTVMAMEVAWLDRKLPAEPASLREKARSVKESIEAAIGTVQRISAELRPGLLDHLGIAAAIAWQAKRFGDRTGIPCAVAHPEREIDLERDRSTALFRIFQEALTNVARHSGADRAAVALSEVRGVVVMTVEDNGKGISMERIADGRSLGLVGMRERVRPFGGAIEFGSNDGSGTSLTVRIPLEGREQRT